MTLNAFDHVNVRTAKLEAMKDWYADVLDLHAGPRPDFGFDGAWLYLGDRAVVHLVEVTGEPQAGGDVTLEHFAFRASGMPEFLAKLDSKGIAYKIAVIEAVSVAQVNIFDPDGNHIHVDFDASEYAA